MIPLLNVYMPISSMTKHLFGTKGARFFAFLFFSCAFCLLFFYQFITHNEQEFLIAIEEVTIVDDNEDFYVEDMLNNFWNLTDTDMKPICTENSSIEVKNWNYLLSSSLQIELTKNCTAFKKFWKFPTLPSSREEADYPLAYVFMGYRNLAQTLRLFRAIYEPQNVYCVNWDNKSDENYQTALRQAVACFPNVIVPNIRRDIVWCGYSLLEATMDCLELLRYSDKPWKYTQIISWNDYPLKTNREIVQIMKILNGTTEIALYKPQHHTFHADKDSQIPKPLLPKNLVLYKSSFAITMPRDFVKFIFDSTTARELYLWFNNSICPEEMYFSTLAHNTILQAPGGFPGTCLQFYNDNDRGKYFISRYQIWGYEEEQIKLCKGTFTFESCVYGVDNVPNLKQQYALVAHKLYDEFEPAALYCLEEWHYNKIANRTNLTDDMIKYYSNMQSVRYHHLNDKDKTNYVCEKS